MIASLLFRSCTSFTEALYAVVFYFSPSLLRSSRLRTVTSNFQKSVPSLFLTLPRGMKMELKHHNMANIFLTPYFGVMSA